MKKLLEIVLLSIIIVSCSTNTISTTAKNDKIYQLFLGVLLDQNELIMVLNEFKKASNGNSNAKALDLTKTYIKENIYNNKLIAYAKSLEGYGKFEEEYFKTIDLPISRKLELLRIKQIDQSEFIKYIGSFNMIKDAAKRLDLIEKFIAYDFPHYHHADFYAKIALMVTKLDSNYKQRNAYESIKSNLKLATLKLNLYVFQKVPTADIEKLIKIQNNEKYKKSRLFIEKVQAQVNKDYLNGLTQKLEDNGIERINFAEILK